MGTRTNIVIEYGSTKTFIYRHWDGYPAVTGFDLIKLYRETNGAGEFVASLLTARRENEDLPQYELTTEVSGDIEFLYVVRFNRQNNNATFKVVERKAATENEWPEITETQIADTKSFDLAGFAFLVNRDRAKMNLQSAKSNVETFEKATKPEDVNYDWTYSGYEFVELDKEEI